MQTRFFIQSFEDYKQAYQQKTDLLKKDPDRVLQVRRGTDGGKQIFRLVERFKGREEAAEAESGREAKRSKKRRGKVSN